MQKKYHYIYIITNIENNKKYIGKHSTDNLEDNYFGSGIIISKIPKNKLKKQIIQFCNSEEEAYKREQYWINHYNAYLDQNFYNLSEGGLGNTTKVMEQRWKQGVYDTESFKHKQSQIMKKRMKEDKNLLQKREQGWNKWWISLTPEQKEQWKRSGDKNGMYGKHHSQESIQKNRKNQPNILQIYCEEQPDLVFLGLKQAAKWCGLKESSFNAISRCIKGQQKTAGTHPVTKERCHWHIKGE